MRTFYIATALERAAEAKAIADQLRGFCLGQTYAWDEHGSVQDDGPERIREVAMNEVSGVLDADLFVCLLPGGRGTHTELGIAIAGSIERSRHGYGRNSSRTIVIVGPLEGADGRVCAFYLHPHVDERFANVGEFLAWMRAWRRCNPLPAVGP